MRSFWAFLGLALLLSPDAVAHPTAAAKAARIEAARGHAKTYISEHLAALGLASVADLREIGVFVDEAAVTLRYQQLYAGLPVMGRQLLVNTEPTVTVLLNHITPTISIDPKPEITDKAALRLALKASGVEGDVHHDGPTLLIVPASSFGSDNPPEDRLAWEVELYRTNDAHPPAYSHAFYIDAHNGGILADVNQIPAVQNKMGTRLG